MIFTIGREEVVMEKSLQSGPGPGTGPRRRLTMSAVIRQKHLILNKKELGGRGGRVSAVVQNMFHIFCS